MLSELFEKNRSYRRFDQSVKITDAELKEMINAARLSASGGNHQALRFAIVNGADADKLFPHLKFAAYLKDWQGPAEGERPVAYIVIMTDSELTSLRGIDIGIAAEAILLSACSMGYGGCMFRSFNIPEVDKLLDKSPYRPELVIALGKPSETVRIVDYAGDVKYYRDENDEHCVPKLSLEQLII